MTVGRTGVEASVVQCNDFSGRAAHTHTHEQLTSLEAKAGHLNEVTNSAVESKAPNDTQRTETATEEGATTDADTEYLVGSGNCHVRA